MKLLKKISYLKKYKLEIIFFLLAFFIRIYKNTKIPCGITWDEAAIGYNGWSVWHYHRDEWLNFMPISFKSFGDYKAPLFIYLVGFFEFLFGMNVFVLRFASGLFGALSVVSFIYLQVLINNYFSIFKKSKQIFYLKLFSGLFLTFSIWHINFTRAAFESGVALFFILLFLIFEFLYLLENKKFYIFVSYNFAVLSLYTYHSPKVVIPIMFMILLFICKNKIKFIIDHLKLSIFPIMLLSPLIYDSFFKKGMTRAYTLFVFNDKYSFFEKIYFIIKNFITHFSFKYLFLGYSPTLRHAEGALGLLYPITGLLWVFGLVYIFLDKNKSKLSKIFILSLAFIFVGLLPATLSFEVPHSNRSLNALIGFISFPSFFISYIFYLFYKNRDIYLYRILKVFVFTLFVLQYIVYFFDYYNYYPKRILNDYKCCLLKAIDIAETNKKQTKAKTILTGGHFDQLYIYILFYKKLDPISYQGGGINYYLFFDDVKDSDLVRKRTVILTDNTSSVNKKTFDSIVNCYNIPIYFVKYAQK